MNDFEQMAESARALAEGQDIRRTAAKTTLCVDLCRLCICGVICMSALPYSWHINGHWFLVNLIEIPERSEGSE
jgi:hypothetical protein